MTKKENLAAALHKASGKNHISVPPSVSGTKIKAGSSRATTRAVGGHFDPAVQRQIRQMALDKDSTVQELLREALNDIFIKYNQNPIA
jgi:hypothetical protein